MSRSNRLRLHPEVQQWMMSNEEWFRWLYHYSHPAVQPSRQTEYIPFENLEKIAEQEGSQPAAYFERNKEAVGPLGHEKLTYVRSRRSGKLVIVCEKVS